ncbi:hypothetical protein P1J78_22530 [Psychromarinibacter sp. C21-152]|uniref:Uncharacterized protein n=1 Tax=Psychromarinibacter sediminicola TaxID=3033385 RepID=A0AAE3NZF1_9RHOB|nr:hypothetical protein [Psychromarinibacter sediminicola]MDF0603512.1 hypothetical protein [Psychromarinibacter sediminicola]
MTVENAVRVSDEEGHKTESEVLGDLRRDAANILELLEQGKISEQEAVKQLRVLSYGKHGFWSRVGRYVR